MSLSDLVFLISSLTHRPASASERRIASAIVTVVESGPAPAFGDVLADEIVLLETAWRESTFRVGAVGDDGRSRGVFQLQRVARGLPVEEQAEIAYARLRESAARCGAGAYALAGYVAGHCSSLAGRRVSAMRMSEVRAMRRAVAERQAASADVEASR